MPQSWVDFSRIVLLTPCLSCKHNRRHHHINMTIQEQLVFEQGQILGATDLMTHELNTTDESVDIAEFLYPEFTGCFKIVLSVEDGEGKRPKKSGVPQAGWYAVLVTLRDGDSRVLATGQPMGQIAWAYGGLLIVMAAEMHRASSQWRWQKAPIPIAAGGRVAPSTPQRQTQQAPPAYQEKGSRS